MSSYTYNGPGTRLRLAGHTLVRGMAVQLDGAAAEAAERHPNVRKVGTAKASAKSDSAPNSGNALAERRALVARAKELGIPATGKSDALRDAIAKAEAAGDQSEDDAE